MICWIDIETIPGQAPWVKELTDKKVSPPANYKKPEAIEKWWQEKGEAAKDEAWAKTALDATLGEIVVIGFAFDDGEVISGGRDIESQNEKDMLEGFIKVLRAERNQGRHQKNIKFGGHNVLFDIGFLWHRCVIHGIDCGGEIPVPFELKPWSSEIIDTCMMWKGDLRSPTSASLELICKALGIPVKTDMSGADVWPAVQAGEIGKVTAYCAEDVAACRSIYKRMFFEPAAQEQAA